MTQVEVTIKVGGHGIAGQGMTVTMLDELRHIGFTGYPEGNAMVRTIAVDLDERPEVISGILELLEL